METTICKPGAYKTPGVYKGAFGIYNGRGVYNDGAGGGNIIYYNTFRNFDGTTCVPEIGPTLNYNITVGNGIANFSIEDDGIRTSFNSGNKGLAISLWFSKTKKYQLEKSTTVHSVLSGWVYGSFNVLNSFYVNNWLGIRDRGAGIEIYGKQCQTIRYGENFVLGATWSEGTFGTYAGIIRYKEPELVFGKEYKTKVIADFPQKKFSVYLNDEFVCEYELSDSDIDDLLQNNKISLAFGGDNCDYTTHYELIKEL